MWELLGLPIWGYIDDYFILSPAFGSLSKFHFTLAKKFLAIKGWEVTKKPNGLVLGEDNKPTELLGLNYTTNLSLCKTSVELPQNKVDLAEHGSKCAYFKAVGGFKYKMEGDRIHYND